MKKKLLISSFLALILVLIGGFFITWHNRHTASGIKSENPATQNAENYAQSPESKDAPEKNNPAEVKIAFVGPRGNLPDGAPKDYGFWSLAIPVPGVLSRSGQPTLSGFRWLKENGWKSDINLRVDGDHAPEVSDDTEIPGFNELGFNYLKIQMLDGAAPTGQQAQQFLSFVTSPENQPAHVHCRGGIGRTGIMVALYRYAVQGWPLDKAIEESRLFQGGISEGQRKWIIKWSETHVPGSYGK